MESLVEYELSPFVLPIKKILKNDVAPEILAVEELCTDTFLKEVKKMLQPRNLNQKNKHDRSSKDGGCCKRVLLLQSTPQLSNPNGTIKNQKIHPTTLFGMHTYTKSLALNRNECGCLLRQNSTSSPLKMNVTPSLLHNAEQLISVAIAGSLVENWWVFCRVVNQANLVVTVKWS